MGAKVRVDRRNNRLFLDIHVRGRRTRIFSELPATPRNLKILEAKAETLERLMRDDIDWALKLKTPAS